MNNRNRLTMYILAALVLGIIIGYIFNAFTPYAAQFSEYMSLISYAFLRLIKMIIAPLVFATLVVGCLLYTSPSPRDRQKSRMPSSA